MKVLVYSTRKDERAFLADAFSGSDLLPQFEEIHLDARTAALAEGYEAVSVFVNDQVDAGVIEVLATMGVRVIALRCAGYNNVDLEAAKQFSIQVVRVPAYSPYAVAEHAAALLLGLNRHIHKAYNRVREGNFSLDGLVGFDLHGKSVGVIGTGTIGQVFCSIMRGFGSQVLAFDPNPNQSLIDAGVSYVALDEIYRCSDVISLHCPLTPQTHHLIDNSAIIRMKPGVLLINTSRGGLVDTQSVIKGLKSGHLGGLALDVYEEEADLFFEDLSDQVIADDDLMRLTTFPNVIITGHQAFLTREALQNIAQTTVSNLTLLAQARPCENLL
jgi:D-lactate dehydrogenase